MSETIKFTAPIGANGIQTLLEIGAKLEREKRQTKEVEGPFVSGFEHVWIVYTEDKP